MSLNNRFPLEHGETLRPPAPPVLSGCWWEQIMARHQARRGARVLNLHQKIPASPLAELSNRWALWNSHCQFITLEIGELSCSDCLSLGTVTKSTCLIMNSRWTASNFIVTKKCWLLFCPSHLTSARVFHFKCERVREASPPTFCESRTQ